MKKKQSAIFKWLLLAVFLFAAGCFYSCGSQTAAPDQVAVQGKRAFQAESAPEGSGKTTGEGSEKWEDTGEKPENPEKREDTGEQPEDPENTETIREHGFAETTAAAETQGRTDSATEYSSMAESALCYVYVCGEVSSPGVYTLPEGARIYEAVGLAGGFTDSAADSWLNLAEPVADGMKLEVPSKTQVKDPAWQAQSRNAAAGSGTGGNAGNSGSAVPGQAALVNLNTASLEELMTLKGIGASRAEDIIRYRKEAGGFTKIEDIMKVPGIKDAAFQKIKENITV